MLSIVYATVLWANFFVKLLMSSAKAAVNSFDECNVFERAAQLSVIVYDNRLNNSNDEVFSINTVCNCNLTKDEQQALKRLKNDKNIVILPADKGRVTVVMDKTDYYDKMDALVNDKQTYELLNVTQRQHYNANSTTNYLRSKRPTPLTLNATTD